MAKNPTNWDTTGDVTATQISGALQFESNTGDLLLQDGTSHLLFEGVTLTPKPQTVWDNL